MLKVVQDSIGLALLRSVILPENPLQLLNQSDAKVAPITIWSPAFSRALGSLLGFCLSSHWFLRIFSFLLIGRCINFSFDFYNTQSTSVPITSSINTIVIYCRRGYSNVWLTLSYPHYVFFWILECEGSFLCPIFLIPFEGRSPPERCK